MRHANTVVALRQATKIVKDSEWWQDQMAASLREPPGDRILMVTQECFDMAIKLLRLEGFCAEERFDYQRGYTETCELAAGHDGPHLWELPPEDQRQHSEQFGEPKL